ncbi:MAG TPA: secretin N-terminal domain-containing protein [Candidatus Baltobacteraceae bacterium]|nr:secretin N-terminal domain-containing protein [Candidatus Baltobacteraceae bacterium]
MKVRARCAVATFLALWLWAAPLFAAPALITIDVHDADIADVIGLLASESGANIVADASLKPERVTLHLHDVTFADALNVLVNSHGLQVRRQGDVLIVGDSEAMNRRYASANDDLGAQTAIFELRHAKPDEIAKEMKDALPPGTVIVADRRTSAIVVSGDADTIARARQLAASLDAPSGGLVTQVYRLRYLRADDAIKQLKILSADGVYVADDAHNAVVASGDRALQESVATFIASVDNASPQVLFEVKVADVMPETTDSKIGFEWGGKNLQGLPSAGSAAYAFAGGSIPVNVTLNALVSVGRAQILATPRLVTTNNTEADLLIGETYPIVFSTSVLGGQNVQFVDIGVKLRLTPTIGPDGVVSAELHPEYSELMGTTSSGYPIIANRKIDSTLRVADGQTIVLGGLMRDVDTATISKVPGLGDIPVLGAFFRNRQAHHERDEIVFLITPHVIYPDRPVPAK